ncbi:MAG: hypothetical protein DYG98_23060 [Haliscomenobacteraceae bacterium CHB4]|nr:hypothetical protein [Haliscomenobacteraceae bacterium CHB4]
MNPVSTLRNSQEAFKKMQLRSRKIQVGEVQIKTASTEKIGLQTGTQGFKMLWFNLIFTWEK